MEGGAHSQLLLQQEWLKMTGFLLQLLIQGPTYEHIDIERYSKLRVGRERSV